MRRTELYLTLSIRAIVLFLVGMLSLAYAPLNITYPYLDKISATFLPQWIYAWAGFDGVHYVGIAMQGYHEFDQAFFPIYPHLVRSLHYFLGDYVMSGLLISHIAFIAGVVLFYEYAKDVWGTQKASWMLAGLLAYPTAFFFTAVYTESLFLLFTIGSLYAVRKSKYLLAGMLAVLASLTRLQGVFLMIPLFFLFWNFNKTSFSKSQVALMLSPLLGLGGYMAYLYHSTGDALYFLTSQASFGAQRSSELILLPQVYYRYLKIFSTADLSYHYGVAVMEFICISGALFIACYIGYYAYLKRNALELGIAFYSLAHLILPTLTGTFSSIPRYSLFALTTYIAFARLKSKPLKVSVLIGSLVTQLILVGLFIHGSFVS